VNKFPRPELLQHENIPKPLHGMNPRTILGRMWWDKKRQEAYAKEKYHCWACGVHKSEAKYHRWLEGHENYDINYETGCVRLIEITALCHSCHNFIHSGRMYMMVQQGEIKLSKMIDIMEHGLTILKRNNLTPSDSTKIICKMLTELEIKVQNEMSFADWQDWHIIFDGKKYYSKFRDINEWRDFYSRERKEVRS